MNQTDEQLLETNGWTVECESPFEVRHAETGSFASGIAAKVLVDGMRLSSGASEELAGDQGPLLAELASLCEHAGLIADAAARSTRDDPWKHAFDLIFSPTVSSRIRDLRELLDLPFNYYDPDGSYQDDVLAYTIALARFRKSLVPLQAAHVLLRFDTLA